MAPSSTRMRSRAAASRAVRLEETGTVIRSGGFLCAPGADAEQMADREHEVRAVHGVEVKGVDAVLGQFLHLAGGDGGGHQLAGLGIVVEAVEFFPQPVRHAGAGAGDEIARLLEIVHRHDAGHDRNSDAAGADAVEVAKVEVVVEEDLGDRTRRTGIDFCLEHIDVGVEVAALGVLLGVSGDGNFDIRMMPLDTGDEIGRGFVAVRMRAVGRADAARRIAAQRHDMANADIVIAADDLVDLAARRPDAGQMGCWGQAGFSQDAGDGGMGALARGSAGAIGHRDEVGGGRSPALDGLPQIALHLLALGREEFEGDCWRFQCAMAIRRGGRILGHGTTNSTQSCKDVRLSCSALKYAERTRSNSPSLMGSCPIYVSETTYLVDFPKDGQLSGRRHFVILCHIFQYLKPTTPGLLEVAYLWVGNT